MAKCCHNMSAPRRAIRRGGGFPGRNGKVSDPNDPTKAKAAQINMIIETAEYRFRSDEAERIHVWNLTAHWILELTVTKEHDGTVYTVTGRYEGTESFVRKLERIAIKNFAKTLEGGLVTNTVICAKYRTNQSCTDSCSDKRGGRNAGTTI